MQKAKIVEPKSKSKKLSVCRLDSSDMYPAQRRAGCVYYSLRDNGKVKKIIKVLRVVLEVHPSLEFDIEDT